MIKFIILMDIMQKCLMQLLHNKTVVYVTHQLEFLDASDLVLVSYSYYIQAIIDRAGFFCSSS